MKKHFSNCWVGFIGFHLCKRLIKENIKIVAIDNLNSYYSIKLKKARMEEIYKQGGDISFLMAI